MKLSEKGKEDLAGFGFAHNCDGAFSLLDDYEFDQDDFEGTVCLTVEEAEILTRCAANEFCRLIMEHAPVDSARQVEVLMYDLVKRIEQAEKP